MLPKPDISIVPMEALVSSIQANRRLPQGLNGENSSSTAPFGCSSFANYSVLKVGSKPLTGVDASENISGVRAEEASEDGIPIATPSSSNPISPDKEENRTISVQKLDPTDSGEINGLTKTKASTSTPQNESSTANGAIDDAEKS
ncbi:hypothetical protein HYFRA_00006932 [Hymenoscyphus fraxineus]|uniref:Uncharacterized protein n=1 Tax=Hymenoscyphus fraxineus TaxID=746836 RepID=A0A9N9PKX1_9HELO|nr:hypothetical protein HYFRA_00006932 [Hymenoscyphus fraxineus]